MNVTAEKGSPDFIVLYHRFMSLGTGHRAELRRARSPDELSFISALYRLFPGERPDVRHRRIAFLLPWCRHSTKPPTFARQLVERQINEKRILQIARTSAPLDLIQFRRIAMHVEPVVDWAQFGQLLWFWNSEKKRKFVEDFYLAHFVKPKGGKK